MPRQSELTNQPYQSPRQNHSQKSCKKLSQPHPNHLIKNKIVSTVIYNNHLITIQINSAKTVSKV